MTRYEDLLTRRQIYRRISQSSDDQPVYLGDSVDDLTSSDIFDDDSEHFGQLRRRSSRRRAAMEMEDRQGGGSWLLILKKLGVLMEMLSRMPLPQASVGGIAGATLLMTFMGPRALVQTLVYPIYRHLIGCLYPAYSSYKAVRSKNVREYVKWMMYWIVFAMFTCLETLADIFISWIPFYYEAKVLIVLWLLSPTTKGSSMIYKKFLHPALSRREQEIDKAISKARDRGYHTVLQLGSKGVNYATNVIVQTALKGSGGLMHQLRKTNSLTDIPESDQTTRWPAVTQAGDDILEEDPAIDQLTALALRKKVVTPVRQRPVSYSDDGSQENKVSRKKSEESSSGYSSCSVSEPGTPKRKEDAMLWSTNKGNPGKPAIIEEDSELYLDNTSEEVLAKERCAPPNLVYENRPQDNTSDNALDNTEGSYHYQNVTITDVTNEGDSHAKTIVSDIVNSTNELLGRITPVAERKLNSEQCENQQILSENTANVVENLDHQVLETNKSDESKNEEAENQIEPESITVSTDGLMDKTSEIPSDVNDTITGTKDDVNKAPSRKESLENDAFFDIKNESIDSEDFADCENIVSGNISIKISQENLPSAPEETRASPDNLQVRKMSLTPSLESASPSMGSASSIHGSAENITHGNLRISPSRKIHVSGKRKAPVAPIEESKDTTKSYYSEGPTKTHEEHDKWKKKSNPSTMSRLMNLPGKILPFWGKSEGPKNDKTSPYGAKPLTETNV